MERRKIPHYIRIVVICILLIAAALYFLPWPSRIDRSMYCAEITKDGQKLTEGNVLFQGWRLNYLFQEDSLILDPVQFPGLAYTLEGESLRIKNPRNNFPFWSGSGASWNEANTTYDFISFLVHKETGFCLIQLNGRYFACVTDPSVPISDILHEFRLNLY